MLKAKLENDMYVINMSLGNQNSKLLNQFDLEHVLFTIEATPNVFPSPGWGAGGADVHPPPTTTTIF